ncbi:MAG: HsdM family class I SAM-dependent methyltransferase [Planctomycetota bacterium]|jgi:hypothetical protein
MNEWEFTADIASQINEILAKDQSLPFSRAKCEQTSKGSRKRRDLTLLDEDQVKILTGEVRFPYRKDGGSPFTEGLVRNARDKARRAKSPFFFTWNVNEFVLWQTTPPKTSWVNQDYRSWSVTRVHKENQLELPMTTHAINAWLLSFLMEFAEILRGTAPIGYKAPDEKFTEALEVSLHLPIVLNLEQLCALYQKPRFKSKLDGWMREEQGWTIYSDPEGVQDNLERASKFACYALVNKLVFHEALLKRYYAKMSRLIIPNHIDTGEALRLHLEGYFAEAKNITGDYETVFGEEHKSIGNRIPFYSDSAVPHWQNLINQIHRFDFSKLDYEIIGNIFERLISPEERHKFGQFYTRVEVVDLINSFCIRTGHEKVMDPACGGGTFLVRAYVRKREIDPSRKHGELLRDLFGVDISHFATHLTTINLATRDLVDDENYPQIGRSDFFDVERRRPFVELPTHIQTKGFGRAQHREVKIPLLDAVVGNPPYIRQEEIPRQKKKLKHGPKHGTKEYYLYLANKESSADLSGRSDVHCYFWPHATSFLKEEGYLCLLTSSQWLDVEYGFRLQEWLLRNFEILAIFESIDEPWFVGARVATAVTILRRQRDETKRMNNLVRFVQLYRPISELLSNDGTRAGAFLAADEFRDEILSLKKNTANERFRARLIPQGQLWKQGVKLGVMMGKSSDGGSDNPDSQDGDYYGGKWGAYLRMPDIWFEVLTKHGDNLVPLGKIAKLGYGIKSGKDCFFFPTDCSRDCLETDRDPADFSNNYGILRKEVGRGKVQLVRCGKGRAEIRAIEAEYLEREIHSIMEVDSFKVTPSSCPKIIILVDKPKEALRGTHVLKYIQWGESAGYHKLSTCQGRVTEDREWYDLTSYGHPSIVLPIIQQYRLFAFLNPNNLKINHALMGLYDVPQNLIMPLCGILNSTIAILSRLIYARVLGNEGNIQLDVYSAKMMLVPNVRACESSDIIRRISDAFKKMTERQVLSFLSEQRLREMTYRRKGKENELDELSDKCELDMPDRRELDDVVLEMLGIGSKKRRQELIDELYTYLREFFELIRQKEEKAIVNKKKAKRKGPARPSEIAAQIYSSISDDRPDLLRQYERDFLDRSKPFDTYEVPTEGRAQKYSDMIIVHAVEFIKGKKRKALVETKTTTQSELMVVLAESGVHGLVRIPCEETECHRVLRKYESFFREQDREIIEMITERTADEDMQEKIYDALKTLILRGDIPKGNAN